MSGRGPDASGRVWMEAGGMAGTQPVVVHPLSPDGGRLVTIRGERVGVAFHLLDLLEFLRRAGLPEADTSIDDPELIEWRGGGPEVWADPPR